MLNFAKPYKSWKFGWPISPHFLSSLASLVQAVVISPRIALALRVTMGDWHFIRINTDNMSVEEMSVAHYLAFKEKLAGTEEGELLGKFLPLLSLFSTFRCWADDDCSFTCYLSLPTRLLVCHAILY